jgi:hypothetical protein
MKALPDSNIAEFNRYVKRQMETLTVEGETTNDLVTNLFKGYFHAMDKDFCEWIKAKKHSPFILTVLTLWSWSKTITKMHAMLVNVCSLMMSSTPS